MSKNTAPKQAIITTVQNGWQVEFTGKYNQASTEREIHVFVSWDDLTSFLMEQLEWPQDGTKD